MVGSETAAEVRKLLNWAPEVRKAIVVAVPEVQGEVLNRAPEVRTIHRERGGTDYYQPADETSITLFATVESKKKSKVSPG
jgi:phosphoglycerate dehydrogenase-like enzyme